MYVLSQIFVLISGCFFASTYLTRNKKLILILNVFNNLFFGTHFLLLKSYTATLSVFLTIFFLVAIYFTEKYNKVKLTVITTIVFSFILIPIAILTWESIVSMLPLMASLLFFIATAFKNTLIVKILYFISTISNTVFMLLIHSYFGFTTNILILIVAIIGIINQIRTTKRA